VDEGDLEAANSSFMWSEENAPTEEEEEVVAATSQQAEKTEVSGNYLHVSFLNSFQQPAEKTEVS
jgi:hypothetical protein